VVKRCSSSREKSSEAGREVVAREQKHRRLARGDEAAVARALHAAELGEAALRDFVARPQHIEQLRPHVRDECEQQHQAGVGREPVLGDEARVRGAAASKLGRRDGEWVARGRAGIGEVARQARLQHAREPLELGDEVVGVRAQRVGQSV